MHFRLFTFEGRGDVMHFSLCTFEGWRKGQVVHFRLCTFEGGRERGRLCILDFVLSSVGGRGRLCILDFALSRVGGRGRCSAACVFHATLHLTLTSFFVIQFHLFLLVNFRTMPFKLLRESCLEILDHLLRHCKYQFLELSLFIYILLKERTIT